MNISRKKIICVVGPTASGKTSLAVYLAKKLDGEIISADSRQVYKKLDIGTGKDLGDFDQVKYHLIDICEPEEKFTMFDWLEQARIKINKLFEEGKVPIVAGGTGLYIQALTEGFVLNQITKAKIKYSREVLDKKNLEELQKIYHSYSLPDSKIDLKNPRRIIRAIERAQEGSEPTKVKPDFEALEIGIKMSQEDLYKKIDKRVDVRFDQEDMLEEVDQLLKSGVDASWLFSLGLEYRIISQFLISKKQSLEEMKNELKNQIHHFAKRQLTWFKRFPDIKWVSDNDEALKLAQDFLK